MAGLAFETNIFICDSVVVGPRTVAPARNVVFANCIARAFSSEATSTLDPPKYFLKQIADIFQTPYRLMLVSPVKTHMRFECACSLLILMRMRKLWCATVCSALGLNSALMHL